MLKQDFRAVSQRKRGERKKERERGKNRKRERGRKGEREKRRKGKRKVEREREREIDREGDTTLIASESVHGGGQNPSDVKS